MPDRLAHVPGPAHAGSEEAAASPPAHGWRWAVDVYLAIRVSALGFTWLLPLVGAATVAAEAPLVQTAWLLLAALAFHVFAYVFNDVVDLRVDASEPLRADSPLVRGVFGRGQALALAGLQWPLAFGALAAAGGGSAAMGSLAVAFAAMTLYDLYGKRCRWPLLTDAVQSLGWCALLLAGAYAFTDTLPAAAGWVAAYVFFCVMLVNGVHGSLRDLANDARHGARTTALWLGARASPAGDGSALLSTALMRYALALQAALVLCACGAWAAMPYASGMQAATALGLLVVALAGACLSLAQGLRPDLQRTRQISNGARNIVATLLVMPALVLPRLGVPQAMILLLAFGLPVLAMWAYNGSHWRLPNGSAPAAAAAAPLQRAVAGVGTALLLMRWQRPLCAAALCGLGAWIAGAREPSFSLGLAATCVACVTAFGFVINDCCDCAGDAFEKATRPLPAGLCAPRAAWTLAAALAVCGLLSAAGVAAITGSAVPAWLACAATALSAAYSLRLKNTLLLGNAAVALLVAAVIVFGALVAGLSVSPIAAAAAVGSTWHSAVAAAAVESTWHSPASLIHSGSLVPAGAWAAAVIAFAYVLAQEVLFTLEDVQGDAAAGLRTTATLLGAERCAKVSRALMLAAVATTLLPLFSGLVAQAEAAVYLSWMALGMALPSLLIVHRLRPPLDAARVAAAARLSRLPWVASLPGLALLA